MPALLPRGTGLELPVVQPEAVSKPGRARCSGWSCRSGMAEARMPALPPRGTGLEMRERHG